jgi:hypothetical protein
MSGMKVSQTEKAARGQWTRILPALGVNVLKITISPVRFVAVKIVFALMIRREGNPVLQPVRGG